MSSLSLTDDPTEEPAARPRRGWIFYDRDCGICRAWANRVGSTLRKRGFEFSALQTPWVMKRLGLKKEELLKEMKVLTFEGNLIGGGDSIVYLARFVWWWWPFYFLAALPGAKSIIRLAYRWFARNRGKFGRACRVARDR